MKRFALCLALAGALLMVTGGAPHAADQEKFPFFPSLLNTSTGGPVSSSEFEDPGRCRICHRDIYKQWKGSMHSNSWVDPVFQAVFF